MGFLEISLVEDTKFLVCLGLLRKPSHTRSPMSSLQLLT